MPAVVFRDPQVASVGFTEERAIAAGYAVRTSTLPLENVPRALAARDTRGLIKLVADGRTRKLLGAHILAPEGADSIQTAAMAIRCGLTIDDLAETIFPYLTTRSEEHTSELQSLMRISYAVFCLKKKK